MNYEERDEYVQQKANEYCKKEKERGTLMKIGGVEALVYKAYKNGYYESEKENKQLEQQIEQLQKINKEQKETLKKVRVALIQERTANIINYGKGGVEMFDNIFEVLSGVSN